MLIEVLCEDKSSLPILYEVFDQVFASREEPPLPYELNVHPHRGKGYLPKNIHAVPKVVHSGLLDLLPAKLRAYEKVEGKPPILVVVILDSDDDDKDQLYQDIEFLIRSFSPRNLFVIGISVEEMEAWLLGDWEAIEQAYPEADKKRWQAYKQDSICGSWECLAEIIEGKDKAEELIEVGYPAVGAYKYRWAERIAPFMKNERNRSMSFQDFLTRLNHILDIADERLSEQVEARLLYGE